MSTEDRLFFLVLTMCFLPAGAALTATALGAGALVTFLVGIGSGIVCSCVLTYLIGGPCSSAAQEDEHA